MILNQIRVVFKHQVVPIYMNGGKPVYFIVGKLTQKSQQSLVTKRKDELTVGSPSSLSDHLLEGFDPSTDGAVSLAPHTELHVQPAASHSAHISNNYSKNNTQVCC